MGEARSAVGWVVLDGSSNIHMLFRVIYDPRASDLGRNRNGADWNSLEDWSSLSGRARVARWGGLHPFKIPLAHSDFGVRKQGLRSPGSKGETPSLPALANMPAQRELASGILKEEMDGVGVGAGDSSHRLRLSDSQR